MYIIIAKTYEILHYWYHNKCILIVTYFIVICFKDILVSPPWRWEDNNTETCRCYVIKIKHKHYRVVHLLVFFILTDYDTLTPLIENYILIIKISRSIFKTQLLHNFHTYWNLKQPFTYLLKAKCLSFMVHLAVFTCI